MLKQTATREFIPPRRFTTAQITHEFAKRAEAAGLELWLDYMAKSKYGRNCHFSAVIVVGKEIVAIVACKNSPNAARRPTRQRTKYESFGVPVVWVCGMERVPAAVLEAKRLALSGGAQLSAEDLAEVGLSDKL